MPKKEGLKVDELFRRVRAGKYGLDKATNSKETKKKKKRNPK